jgi:hypothetical protein
MNFLYLNETKNDLINYFISIISPQLCNSVLEVHTHSINMFNNLKMNFISNKKDKKIIKMFKLQNININNLTDDEKDRLFNKLKLDIFRMYIEKIYRWNNQQIYEEYNRIKLETKTSDYFDNLIRACFKSYLLFISYDSNTDESFLDEKYLNNDFYKKMDIISFIHTCFLETFYFCENNYDYFLKKLKRNEINDIIKICIMNSIKKSIPDYNDIIKDYLKLNVKISKQDEVNKIKKLVKEVIEENNINLKTQNTIGGNNSSFINNENKHQNVNILNNQETSNESNKDELNEEVVNEEDVNEENVNEDNNEVSNKENNEEKENILVEESKDENIDEYDDDNKVIVNNNNIDDIKTVSNLESNYIKSIRASEDKDMDEYFEKMVK